MGGEEIKSRKNEEKKTRKKEFKIKLKAGKKEIKLKRVR